MLNNLSKFRINHRYTIRMTAIIALCLLAAFGAYSATVSAICLYQCAIGVYKGEMK
jgi:uncharacterized membrane protein